MAITVIFAFQYLFHLACFPVKAAYSHSIRIHEKLSANGAYLPYLKAVFGVGVVEYLLQLSLFRIIAENRAFMSFVTERIEIYGYIGSCAAAQC